MKSVSSRRWGGILSAVGALVLTSGGLAGCSGSTSPQSPASTAQPQSQSASESPASGGTPTPSGTTSASPSPTSSASDDPSATDETWTTEPQTSDASNMGPDQVVTDFRLGSHDGYDRVVVELTGDGTPGWMTNWTDHVAEQGRGLPLDLEGPVFLDVKILGAAYPAQGQTNAYTTHGRKESGDIRAFYDSVFEGEVHLAIGMDQQRPYRIFALSNPTRVVIDVKKP